jgi:predicted CopG family antitoxin
MKTITLTEEAYERLLSWKQTPKESFSKVVISLIPPRGTLGQIAGDIKSLPPITTKHLKAMEDAASWGRKPSGLKDKWTS